MSKSEETGAGEVQSRLSGRVLLVDGGRRLDQRLHVSQVGGLRGDVQRRLLPVVDPVDLGTGRQQRPNKSTPAPVAAVIES